MAVIAAGRGVGAAFATRGRIVLLLLIAIAAAGAIGIFYQEAYGSPDPSSSGSGNALARMANHGANGMKTIADMLMGRSPGERAQGALANLKPKRQPVLHERALAKVRRQPPVSPFASLVGPPPEAAPVVPPVAGPLYKAVTAAPPVTAVVGEAPPTLFPAFSPPPGGGFIVPPIINQVTPPVPPAPPGPTPAVPEPGSWLMMLVGFALLGRGLKGTPRLHSAAS